MEISIMEDLLNTDDDNLGGLQELRFTPIRFLTSVNPLTFLTGRTWITIQCTPESGILNEQTAEDDHGDTQNVTIPCAIPKIRPEIHAVLNKYRREICVIECRDMNDYWRRVGTWAGQIRLYDQSSTGGAVTDMNGYNIQFKGRQLKPAIFI